MLVDDLLAEITKGSVNSGKLNENLRAVSVAIDKLLNMLAVTDCPRNAVNLFFLFLRGMLMRVLVRMPRRIFARMLVVRRIPIGKRQISSIACAGRIGIEIIRLNNDEILHQINLFDISIELGTNPHNISQNQFAVILSDVGDIFCEKMTLLSANFIYVRKTHYTLLLKFALPANHTVLLANQIALLANQLKSLLKLLVALADCIDRLVKKLAGLAFEFMCELVKLFGVVSVVRKHIFQKCESLLV